MKKIISLLVLVLTLIICLAAASAEKLIGGWEIPVAESTALPEDAQVAFDKAMVKLIGAEYTPVALLATQVVAGTNYCILCQVTPVVPDPIPHWSLVYLYANLDGDVEIMNVFDLDIGAYAFPDEAE